VKLSIIIPVYNEENTIGELVGKVQRVRLPIEKEIIVVDDGSTDGTCQRLKEIDSPVQVIYQPFNQGKGAAVRLALERVTGDLVLIQDADLEYDPGEYPKLLAPFVSDHCRVVYGSRFSNVSGLAGLFSQHQKFHFWHLVYFLGNKFLTLVTKLLYGSSLTDMETCYKMLETGLMKSLNLKANRFEFEPEITAKILKRKIRICEVPISYHGREYSEGKKISWRDGLSAIKVLIKCRFSD